MPHGGMVLCTHSLFWRILLIFNSLSRKNMVPAVSGPKHSKWPQAWEISLSRSMINQPQQLTVFAILVDPGQFTTASCLMNPLAQCTGGVRTVQIVTFHSNANAHATPAPWTASVQTDSILILMFIGLGREEVRDRFRAGPQMVVLCDHASHGPTNSWLVMHECVTGQRVRLVIRLPTGTTCSAPYCHGWCRTSPPPLPLRDTSEGRAGTATPAGRRAGLRAPQAGRRCGHGVDGQWCPRVPMASAQGEVRTGNSGIRNKSYNFLRFMGSVAKISNIVWS